MGTQVVSMPLRLPGALVRSMDYAISKPGDGPPAPPASPGGTRLRRPPAGRGAIADSSSERGDLDPDHGRNRLRAGPRIDCFFSKPEVSLVEFLTGTKWQPHIQQFGIWPLLTATLVTSTIAMLVALPLGMRWRST